MSNELEYGIDPLGKSRLYGIYVGKVIDINDPLKRYRVRVKVPTLFGNEVTEWADACLPVSSNDHHPDHKTHLASQTVSQIQNHSGTFACSSGGSVTVTFDHNPTSVQLNHDHVTTSETKYDQTEGDHSEHTLHRRIPRVGQTVWVMFKAGDPDYPVWIGVGHEK